MPNSAETLVAKAMAVMEKGKASLEGLSGIFSKLVREHGEVSALLMRVTASSDPSVRTELFPTIRAELLSHEKGELMVLYPALRAFSETAWIADKHYQEAMLLEKTLESLRATPYDDASWEPQFSALVDLVKRHVAEEEEEFFPAGQKVLADLEDELLEQFEEVKQRELQLA